MQPPAIEAGSSIWPTTSPASMLISPKSFTTTPTRAPGRRSSWFTTVVLPAPRCPVTAITGTRIAVASCP
jgi:hypothetical protein